MKKLYNDAHKSIADDSISCKVGFYFMFKNNLTICKKCDNRGYVL